MPLQIRRGTDAERTAMTQPLAAGELIFVTSTNRLFIGNGTTLGGVPVTDYSDEQARDIAASIFVAGTHNSITFAYDDALDKINATVNLSDYQGVIKAAAFNGSVVANDSSLLIDGNTGRFNLSGSIGTDIIPDTDLAYDLGSATYRFRDLYLSGSSIKLGAATITSTGTAVNLPAGSTIGGSAIGIPGGDLNVNIVADDSTVIVNTTTEVVTAQGGFVGNVTGNLTGIATSVANGVYITDTGTVTNTMLAGSIADTKLATISTAGKVSNSATTATALNNVDTIVSRNGTGDFAANFITATGLTGNVTGNINGVVTGTAGSSLIGNVTGSTTGFHTGDVKGSIFGDDSTTLVDGVAGKIVAPYDNSSLSIVSSVIQSTTVGVPFAGAPSDNQVIIGSTTNPNTLLIYSDNNIGIFENIADGTGDVGGLNFKTSRGSPSSKTTVVAGDASVLIIGKVFTGTDYADLGAIYLGTDPAEPLVATGAPTPSVFGAVVYDATGTDKTMSFNSKGILNAPVLKSTVYSVAGTALPSAVTRGAGARAFVSDATLNTFAAAYAGGGANNVPVYSDGTIWRIG